VEVVGAAIVSIREALAAHLDGASVRQPGAMWLVCSAVASRTAAVRPSRFLCGA
jgi:hypothetical protein